jgi:NTE family protein
MTQGGFMKKIAIACQGGGSQTAFTAGVLKTFFELDLHKKMEIQSLSGTSGGAVCAVLSWYGLLKFAKGDTTPIQQRITDFWDDLSAKNPIEQFIDRYFVELIRLTDSGAFPKIELSPLSSVAQTATTWLAKMIGRDNFTDLKKILETHVNFGEINSLVQPSSPVLFIGAANVLTGELKKFSSLKKEINVNTILASAAVPSIFPPIKVGNDYYWDGLFSDNPPVDELVRPVYVGAEKVPDEVWIIQINPMACKKTPSSPLEIVDRRNEMVGNISFMHDMEKIEFLNLLLYTKAIKEEIFEKLGIVRREPIKIRLIRMSQVFQDNLDYVTKLSREPGYLNQLMEDGRKQALAFLKVVEEDKSPWEPKDSWAKEQLKQYGISRDHFK